jgi:hypothetical protein
MNQSYEWCEVTEAGYNQPNPELYINNKFAMRMDASGAVFLDVSCANVSYGDIQSLLRHGFADE